MSLRYESLKTPEKEKGFLKHYLSIYIDDDLMVSKTISVTQEVYDLLSRFKLPHESFGDAIKRLCEEKTAVSIYEWIINRPLWSDMPEEEYKQIKNNISGIRERFTIQEVNIDDDG